MPQLAQRPSPLIRHDVTACQSRTISGRGHEVIVRLPEPIEQALVSAGVRFQRGWRSEPRHHRFVCSWAIREAHVDALLALCAGAVEAGRWRRVPAGQ